MNLFEKRINEYSQSYSQFCETVKAYYKMTEEQKKISTDEEKRRIYDAKHKIYHHVGVCNAIAEKIGFQSLTKDFSNLGTPYEWLLIVLSQEQK